MEGKLHFSLCVYCAVDPEAFFFRAEACEETTQPPKQQNTGLYEASAGGLVNYKVPRRRQNVVIDQ